MTPGTAPSAQRAVLCYMMSMVKPVPQPTSILEEVDEEEEVRAIAEAEAEIAAGLGVEHARVRKWLQKLGKGEDVPPPCK